MNINKKDKVADDRSGVYLPTVANHSPPRNEKNKKDGSNDSRVQKLSEEEIPHSISLISTSYSSSSSSSSPTSTSPTSTSPSSAGSPQDQKRKKLQSKILEAKILRRRTLKRKKAGPKDFRRKTVVSTVSTGGLVKKRAGKRGIRERVLGVIIGPVKDEPRKWMVHLDTGETLSLKQTQLRFEHNELADAHDERKEAYMQRLFEEKVREEENRLLSGGYSSDTSITIKAIANVEAKMMNEPDSSDSDVIYTDEDIRVASESESGSESSEGGKKKKTKLNDESVELQPDVQENNSPTSREEYIEEYKATGTIKLRPDEPAPYWP